MHVAAAVSGPLLLGLDVSYDHMTAIRPRYLSDSGSSATSLGPANLAVEGLLIEIDVIAVVAD